MVSDVPDLDKNKPVFMEIMSTCTETIDLFKFFKRRSIVCLLRASNHHFMNVNSCIEGICFLHLFFIFSHNSHLQGFRGGVGPLVHHFAVAGWIGQIVAV